LPRLGWFQKAEEFEPSSEGLRMVGTFADDLAMDAFG